MTSPPEITRRSVGLRSERGPILLSVMLSTGLVAIDSTILATAVPALVADIGGFAQFPWLFSIYLLAQAVMVPVYGKLSDIYGRKPIMLLGVGLFVAGSVLCGLAWNMPALIVFRAIQGLGAGAILPTGMTIIGDLYTLAERAKVQGYVASVWAMSAVVGPTLGGLFVDFLNWRWIFFVNIPLGALAALFLIRRFREEAAPRTHRVDVAGAILLTLAGTAIILGLLEGGVLWAWSSAPSIAVFGVGVCALITFVLVERRAEEPVLPGWIFTQRLLNSTNLANFVAGVAILGLTSYVPLYAQNVLGHSALVAGFALAAMSVGWPLAATLAGRVYLRIGFRATAVIGATITFAGTLMLVPLSPQSSIWYVAAACFVIGVGMGSTVSPALIAAQTGYPRRTRGTVTGTAMFARSIGSAVGVAAFGAVVNAILADRLGSGHHEAESVPAADLAPAVHGVFVAAAITAALLVLAALAIPGQVTEATE